MAKNKKYVYFFGDGKADGDGSQRELLGGKGANLAEMAGHPDLQLPVPAGFTITTEVCTYFNEHKHRYPRELKGQVEKSLRKVERTMGRKFGDPKNPLLVSVRSGARKSMPGMMETVLNVGLTSKTLPGVIRRTQGNERFAYDAYRRLIAMYADVVMEKAQGIQPADDEGIRRQLDRLLQAKKSERGVKEDIELTTDDLRDLCEKMKERVREVLGKKFPDKAEDQLWGAIHAVFMSWNGKRAVSYRRIEQIPDWWGTAVNVQSMVFGNMGDTSATGVAFTRDPGTGENLFYGEYLPNAQGEDVVAGVRTPHPINDESTRDYNRGAKTLADVMPKVYRQLFRIQKRLEKHYRDMQDIEFTIEKGTLWMLQCRTGKRNGPAAVRMAIEMLKERLINKEQAVVRVTPDQLNELLHPILDPEQEKTGEVIAKGLPAGPGGANGQIVFTADEAVQEAGQGRRVILVREETNPEDVEGMRAAQAILTARGGMTSHAALVARGWGKCCIVGCNELEIDSAARRVSVNGRSLGPDDWLSLNGSSGFVYSGRLEMVEGGENKYLDQFLEICDKVRRLKVRTNADTPADAHKAIGFGAEGIGLFRTEHMFYGENSEQPLALLRRVILAPDRSTRLSALENLFGYIKADMKATLEAMDDRPVTIRLLDPPLHEFVPSDEKRLGEIALDLGITLEQAKRRADGLKESNPMMGHRGVRLGVTYPEVTETQVRAILEAAAELIAEGKKALPEIMVPLVAAEREMSSQFDLIERIHKAVCDARGIRKVPHLVGTMIEIPRAALIADRLAETADFFSFGTNDLTQMGFGFSRDDTGGFLGEYIEQGILPADPFETLDQEGVGQLVQTGIERGRGTRPALKVGICGEHGGDAESVKFCHRAGMDYVSCSPFRVPIARLAAAQAVADEVLAAASAPRKARRRPAKKAATSGKTGKTAKKAKGAKAKKKKKTKTKKAKASKRTAKRSASSASTNGRRTVSKKKTAKTASKKKSSKKSGRTASRRKTAKR